MIRIVYSLVVYLSFFCLSQAQTRDTISSGSSNKGKIYFIRATGFAGSASAFKMFIDNGFVCRLNNNMYSIHEVPVGKHNCSVQFGGTKHKEGAELFEIEVEPGKTKYVQVVFETGLWVNNVYCEEITENTALKKMQNLSEDKECQ